MQIGGSDAFASSILLVSPLPRTARFDTVWHSPKSVDKYGVKTEMAKCKCGEQNALAPTDA